MGGFGWRVVYVVTSCEDTTQGIDTASARREISDGVEGDVIHVHRGFMGLLCGLRGVLQRLCLLLGGLRLLLGGLHLGLFGLCGLEFAVDGDVGVLVETGVAFHARFGCGTAFDDTEIMLEEADMPVDTGIGAVMFEGMCAALRFLDEFAVSDTGCRPRLGETVGVELQELSSAARDTADDDVFFVVASFLDGVHGAPQRINAYYRHKIAHSPCMGSGNVGMRRVVRNSSFQTPNNARFQMLRHDF